MLFSVLFAIIVQMCMRYADFCNCREKKRKKNSVLRNDYLSTKLIK